MSIPHNLVYTRQCEFGDDCAAPGLPHLKEVHKAIITPVAIPKAKAAALRFSREQVVTTIYQQYMGKEKQ
jgi:hypothetical protein